MKGWYANIEGESLVAMAANMPNDLVVELGTAWGLSASYILWGTDARMVCIDIWEDSEVFDDFCSMIEAHGWENRVRAIRQSSHDAAAGWQEPIGLLHIDAAHDYDSVLADYRLWSPHIAPGGWIVFHDSQTKGVGTMLRQEVWPDKQWIRRQLTMSQWAAQRG